RAAAARETGWTTNIPDLLCMSWRGVRGRLLSRHSCCGASAVGRGGDRDDFQLLRATCERNRCLMALPPATFDTRRAHSSSFPPLPRDSSLPNSPVDAAPPRFLSFPATAPCPSQRRTPRLRRRPPPGGSSGVLSDAACRMATRREDGLGSGG